MEMKKIGPKALENHLGDRVFLWCHAGAGKYSRFKGSLEQDRGGDFYVQDSEYREYSLLLKHGDSIDIQTSRSIKGYVFIDDSD